VDPGIRPLLELPGVKYHPGVERQLLSALYRESAVFVMPSLVEGFGLVYLEALAAGLHCIGTPNTGLPDLRLPDNCVSIVPPGQVGCLAESLMSRCADFLNGKLIKSEIRSQVEHLTWDFRRAEMRSVIERMVRAT
jgi:glycosyltransferase involved in cell wall biosynthesis